MFHGDFRAETINASQLFMVFGRTRMGQSATRNNPTRKQKTDASPSSGLASVTKKISEIDCYQIRKEYSLEFSFTEM